jgi:hypothetical protein
MKIFLLLFAYSVCTQFAFGQNTNFTIKEIDSIVKRIDSTCISGGVTDYILHKKGHKKKTIGGGADWFFTDTSGAKLLKAVRETSIESENRDSYYFYNDSLIYLKISHEAFIEDKNKINWQGQYYFQNSKLIFKQDNLKLVFNPERYLETARQFFNPEQIWIRPK